MITTITPERTDKRAKTHYPVSPEVAVRWSPRALKEDPIPHQDLGALLEAARWAPSCFNEQPWRFFIGDRSRNPKQLEQLQTLLMEGNSWAKKAPVLILACGSTRFALNNEYNRHYAHDVGLALGQLGLEAIKRGLVTHCMAGFYVDKAKKLLSLPPSIEPMTMVAIAYQANPDTLDNSKLRDAELSERNRKPFSEIMLSGTWGQPFSYIS